MTKLIGLSGPAGVGKDSFADHLVKKYGFKKMSLADPMKRIAKDVYDFSDLQLWGPSAERNKPDHRYLRDDGTYLTPREALQVLGTEFGRRCYINTWIDMALRQAKAVMGSYLVGTDPGLAVVVPGQSVVIPDVRFKNEIEAIQKAGGKVIRLKRSTEVDAMKVGVQGHASEAEQLSIPDSEFDLVLSMPQGLPNAYERIDFFYDMIME